MKVCPRCGGAYPVEEGFCPMDGTRLETLHATDTSAPPGSAPHHEFLGRVLDRRYRLDEVIGEGAMGVVFRATHTLIGRRFAVKVLRREHLDVEQAASRFLLEARSASSVKHPNVVDISDFGELPEGGAFYVMELLEGRSLARVIDTGGPMSPADAGLIGLQIANGLAAAHAMGVVHRDLKPDNVFVCTPRRGMAHALVKLLDFGIARVGPRRITVVGAVLGTPEYMSPEMACGRDVDHRADLYALGVILFEMLTATVPFRDKELSRTLEMHVRAPRPSLVSRRPELASIPHVAELVTALMAVDTDARPATADVAARMLAAALAHDLDRDAAVAVQRATLAMGSSMLPEPADPSRPAQWQGAPAWPAPTSDAILGRAACAAAPMMIAEDAPVVVARTGPGRAAAAALGAALIAGAATFGVVRWVGVEPTTGEPAAEVAPAGDAGNGAEAESAARRPALIAAPPAAGSATTPPQAPGPIVTPTEPPMSDPTPPTPNDATEVAPRSGSTQERTKAKRRRDPAPAPANADDGTGPAPAAADPPSPAPPVPGTGPDPAPPKTSPLDLKDPFPKK